MPNFTSGFIRCLKRLIVRRERPILKTLKRSKQELSCYRRSIRTKNRHLNQEQITWKFIIPKAPWWDDQFERLIGLTKHSLRKSIRRSQMTYYELEEMQLDVEINLNNRSLTYVVDDIQLNVLTTNSMIVGRDVRTINSTADGDSDEWTKRQR